MMYGNDAVDLQMAEHTSATDAQLSLADIIRSTEALKDLLREETSHLKAMNLKGVHALREEKNRLIRKIELQKEFARQHPDLVVDRSEQRMTVLQILSHDLESVMRENFSEVLKAKEINQRVIEAVSAAVAMHK